MEMEREEERSDRGHILAVPIPGQGHINPMVQFSKRLASKGLKVTLALPMVAIETDATSIPTSNGSICIEKMFNSSDDQESSLMGSIELVVSKGVPELIAKYRETEYPINCVLYDSHMPCCLDIARKEGVSGATLFTQSCAVGAVYYKVCRGMLKLPLESPFVSISEAGLPLLAQSDLSSFIRDIYSYPLFLEAVVNQFSNFDEADWIFSNTCDCLEEEVVKWMASQWPIKTIGPTIPSKFLDKRLVDDNEYGLNLFKPNVDACMKWLDSKGTCSVTYVSYGSLAEMGIEAMEELAWGLRNSNTNFLWVVRESEQGKLPSKFVEETSDKGLVVTWCHQLDVLAHQAVGCFVTHCGWNSTLEGLSLGVPMVAMPQWTDQPTNAKFIEDVWGVGVRVKKDGNGDNVVKREEIERCIRKVMEGEEAAEMRMNAAKWKELIKKAADEGGSSDRNIEEFVASFDAKADQKRKLIIINQEDGASFDSDIEEFAASFRAALIE